MLDIGLQGAPQPQRPFSSSHYLLPPSYIMYRGVVASGPEGVPQSHVLITSCHNYLSKMPVLGRLGDGVGDVRARGPEQHQLVRPAVHHVEERLHAHCCVALRTGNSMIKYYCSFAISSAYFLQVPVMTKPVSLARVCHRGEKIGKSDLRVLRT